MALPLNTSPIYNLTIPSTKQNVKFRPFVVKEEKALLIAQQSEDTKVMVDTLKSVVASCVKDNIDIDKLAIFDLEYIFTQLRARSVGEVIEVIMSCDEDHGDKDNLAKVKIQIDLTKLNVSVDEKHTNKISLFGDVGVVMRYPSIDILKKLESIDAIASQEVEAVFNIVVECIDYIYDAEEVYHAKDQTKKELIDFIENLSSDQFKLVQAFFETLPKMSHKVEYNCPVCGKHHDVALEGLESFF
jgi:hypothetical protein